MTQHIRPRLIPTTMYGYRNYKNQKQYEKFFGSHRFGGKKIQKPGLKD